MSRVFVADYSCQLPPDATYLPMDTRSCISWQRQLSPAHLGPVTMWGGSRATNLHNALVSTVYNGSDDMSLVTRRANMMWRTPAVPADWRKARYFHWGGTILTVQEWRRHVLGPLVLEALDECPAVLQNLNRILSEQPGVTLRDMGAAKWSYMTPLGRILNNSRKLITHAHVIAAVLTQDEILDEFETL